MRGIVTYHWHCDVYLPTDRKMNRHATVVTLSGRIAAGIASIGWPGSAGLSRTVNNGCGIRREQLPSVLLAR